MHNWHFDVVKWDKVQAQKVIEEEHKSLVDWLNAHGYMQVAAKLNGEKCVYEYLRHCCELLKDGRLSERRATELNSPKHSVLE